MQKIQTVMIVLAIIVVIAGTILLNADITYASTGCDGGASCWTVCACGFPNSPNSDCTAGGVKKKCWGAQDCPRFCLE